MSETPELIAALCKAQASFGPAIKDAANPFFKSKYADLGAVWEACKTALAENGLFVSQQPNVTESGLNVLKTRVYHTSGGFIESVMPVVVTKTNDPQAFGSAMTYTRRYSLAATLGIITEDDDAEGAMNRNNSQKPKEQAQPAAEAAALSQPCTSEQKDAIIKLLAHPLITKDEKKKMLDNVGKMDVNRAAQSISKLRTTTSDREKAQAQQLHDLITENSEAIGDDLVAHYLKIVEGGKVTEIRDTLDKVAYLLKNPAA